ncbi:MAG: GTP-binding protein [Bacteroidales bacterium]|nr:GTP-binding protein [Bacteroidales bacterium]
MNSHTIPVLLLTGYLGSGKTTLLNRILANQQGIKFAVIVNDIGEVNIDADLIERGGIVGQKDDSLVALQNGCICCTLKMDLVEQLHDITSQRRFDYIVIEASGICEPEPIAQTICSMPTMGPEYIKDGIPLLDSIVTVVDALRMKDEFGSGHDLLRPQLAEDDIENLVIQQIEFCNIILLNKASMVSADERGRIRAIIAAIQPQAKILECDYCDVPLEQLLHTRLFDFDRVATSAAWINEIEGHHDDEEEHEHEEHEHHHHHHDDEGEAEEYGIGTFVYYRREAMNLGRFDEFVARHMPKEIIRTKGICWFDSEPDTCYLFEQAGSQVSLRDAGAWYATMPTDELQQFMNHHPDLVRDWDDTYGDRMQKLVFIGQHLDRAALTAALDQCLC